MSDRYYVDERAGCLAVRDRQADNPDPDAAKNLCWELNENHAARLKLREDPEISQ